MTKKKESVIPIQPQRLKVSIRRGVPVVDSREVAEMIGRPHWQLLRTIDTMIRHLTDNKIVVSEFFLSATYIDETGRTLPRYNCTRKGCDMVANKQIGEALGYRDPQKAIDKIHERYKSRLDPLSVTVNLGATDGKNYDKILYAAKGVYEICRHSDKPNADAFYDFVYEILEGLRLGHLRIVAEKGTDEWQQARQLTKETRKAETDVIKEFVEYARLMGSKNADYYYTSLSTLANKSVEIKDRDFTEGEKLHNLHLIERVIAKALREGMGAGRDYHDIFKDAKRRGEQFAELISLQEGA